MTQQYLAGELSLLLAQLQAVSPSRMYVRELARLRREAETFPVPALGGVTERALALTDGLCWDSLAHGEPASFDQLAIVGAELRDFGVCAGMLDGE